MPCDRVGGKVEPNGRQIRAGCVMSDSSSRHREPALGGVAIQGGRTSLVHAALDCFVASLLAMTFFGVGDRS